MKRIRIKTFILVIYLFSLNIMAQTITKHCPPLVNPPDAMALNQEGVVVVTVGVDFNGKLLAAEVSRTSGYESLDRASLEWLKKCRFSPAMINYVPVDGKQNFVQYYVSKNRSETEDVRRKRIREENFIRTGFYPEMPNDKVNAIIDAAINAAIQSRAVEVKESESSASKAKLMNDDDFDEKLSQYLKGIPEKFAAQAREKEDKNRAWLITAEGKKFLADEEIRQKNAERERLLNVAKAEEAEKNRLAKLGPPRFKVFSKSEINSSRLEKFLIFQSLDGDVQVKKILFNRGGCDTTWLYLTGAKMNGLLRLPTRLNYGEALKVPLGKCELLEATIQTNRGDLTYKVD